MITLDQVLLLQEKVESAVAKIAQLKAENDALRSKCAELTNALSAKTEQFSTFEADQSKIEHGILQALERLNAVENAVVQAAGAGEAPAAPQPAEAAAGEEQAAAGESALQPDYAEQAPTATDAVEAQAPVQQEAAPAAEPQIQDIPAPQAEAVPQEPIAAEAAPVADDGAAQQAQDDASQGQFDIF